MNIQRIGEHSIPIPKRETEWAAGFDLRSAVERVIVPGTAVRIQTGFAWEIPDGAVGLICPRSGLAAKHGITVLNSPGVVDSDYRGEVCVLLMNHSQVPFYVSFGDRIAQLLIFPLHPVAFADSLHEVPSLTRTDRGGNGFGSSGVA